MKKHDETETLRKVLEDVGIPDSCYSIGNYKEGAVCIEKTEEGYIVYDAEMAEKYDIEKYEAYGPAAFSLIARIAMTKEDAEELQNGLFEEILKETLSEVLELNNLSHLCSLDGYAEEAICMEKSRTGYIVYIVERNYKHDFKRYPKISTAFCDIISRLSESDEEETKIRREFMNSLSKKAGLS